MEEFGELDKKAIEKQYLKSYSYTRSQRIAGMIAFFIVLCGFIALWVLVIESIINFIKQ